METGASRCVRKQRTYACAASARRPQTLSRLTCSSGGATRDTAPGCERRWRSRHRRPRTVPRPRASAGSPSRGSTSWWNPSWNPSSPGPVEEPPRAVRWPSPSAADSMGLDRFDGILFLYVKLRRGANTVESLTSTMGALLRHVEVIVKFVIILRDWTLRSWQSIRRCFAPFGRREPMTLNVAPPSTLRRTAPR